MDATANIKTVVHVTFFKNKAATTLTAEELTLAELAERVLNASARRKDLLPWLKFARFGTKRTEKNSLRHDDNLEQISGIEIDCDTESIAYADMITMLKALKVKALAYTSPSHTADKPRWRVLAPTSQLLSPSIRTTLVARLNGAMKAKLGADKIAAPESFTLSQSYFYGWVMNKAGLDHHANVTDGDFIDQRYDLAQYEATGTVSAAADKTITVCSDDGRAHGFENILAEMGDGQGLRGFNDPLTRAAASYVKLHNGNPFDEEKLKALLRDAINKAPRKSTRDPDVIARYLGDHYLDSIIVSARKFVNEGAIALADFYAYMPTHNYLFVPTRELWPASSVNSRLSPVAVIQPDGTPVKDRNGKTRILKPSLWLDAHRPVEQMTWVPGEPLTVADRLISDGGWVERPGVSVFNLYRPPTVRKGNSAAADTWIELAYRLYPHDADHLIRYFAHCVQHPAVKINHGLILGGAPGIGKDTLLEPLKLGVGPWNFKEVSPQDIMSSYNDYMRCVVLRISEVRDLGDVNRFAFYEHMKTILATPPDVIRVNGKYTPQYYLLNVAGVINTTNHRFDGVYLPADDRRTYVAWSEAKQAEFVVGFFPNIWTWYNAGGLENVVAYLSEYDLSGFDPKAPPKKTEAFWQIVGVSTAPEEGELADILDQLGKTEKSFDANGDPCRPVVTTLAKVLGAANGDLFEWLKDRKNRRVIPHKFEACGCTPLRNPDAKDGLWVIGGKRQVVYGRSDATLDVRLEAARKLARDR